MDSWITIIKNNNLVSRFFHYAKEADVKIIKKSDAGSLDIERVSKNDSDYQLILNGRMEDGENRGDIY